MKRGIGWSLEKWYLSATLKLLYIGFRLYRRWLTNLGSMGSYCPPGFSVFLNSIWYLVLSNTFWHILRQHIFNTFYVLSGRISFCGICVNKLRSGIKMKGILIKTLIKIFKLWITFLELVEPAYSSTCVRKMNGFSLSMNSAKRSFWEANISIFWFWMRSKLHQYMTTIFCVRFASKFLWYNF